MPTSDEETLLTRVDLFAEHGGLRDRLNLLYKFLDVVDSKASTLLRFNGIILAVLALFIRLNAPTWRNYAYLVVILTLIVSCAFCFSVVKIAWGFLSRSSEKPQAEFEALAKAVLTRTRSYQIAGISRLAAEWCCSR